MNVDNVDKFLDKSLSKPSVKPPLGISMWILWIKYCIKSTYIHE